MPSPASNIRVFVHWAEPTVFAGEEVECRITFKNIAATPGAPRPHSSQLPKASSSSPGDRHRREIQTHAQVSRNGSLQSRRSPEDTASRGHRAGLSLDMRSKLKSAGAASWSAAQNGTAIPSQNHRRSVSILSLGANDGVAVENPAPNKVTKGALRPGKGHARSVSAQVLPRRGLGISNLDSISAGQRSSTHPSPLILTTTPPSIAEPPEFSFPPKTPRNAANSSPSPASTPEPRGMVRKPSGSFSLGFRFPVGSPRQPELMATLDSSRSPRSIVLSSPANSPRIPEDASADLEHLKAGTRVLSASSMNGGTPRSSGEFYSLSNNSTETLASEYNAQAPNRLLPRPGHVRRPSHLGSVNYQKQPEVLMMGYAQVVGSFTVDGSLVNQAPFEEVKRRGVVGGQGGGGVVGVETKRREGSLFGALGWANIGESLGGLLGSRELSSIKEMRGIASSKSIPLLSTPQSILFVDLHLAPGESKSYSYSFRLPRGLPPTHKGKAIKVSYNVVIGTQRAITADGQQLKQVDVPFRVFGGVNGRGELLGHDLLSPYIILQDQAHTSEINENVSAARNRPKSPQAQPSSGLDFISYVEALLAHPHENNSTGLLSPTETPTSRRQSVFSISEPSSAKSAIDLAIQQSTISLDSSRRANRFEIARNGKRVAVLTLARPAWRLGETLSAVIDFEQAQILCYAVHASLETAEIVDPALSLRSAASIHRVTRRLHASQSENTLFARRISFSPTIPITATPNFFTTGVSLEWKLRVEFITPRSGMRDEEKEAGEEHEEAESGDEESSALSRRAEPRANALLEEVARDERGTILAAVEGIACESFEVAVPIRVYGAVAGGAKDLDTGREGLVI
ncbi:MAG: hypothetical protein M1829_002474 [Trizodia sp. TS-e1964]|nr:MAG: hypothetical protein M1829_002474 [Trizodia sp. TS-e1964]